VVTPPAAPVTLVDAGDAGETATIELRDVGKHFSTAAGKVVALESVSLIVNAGEFVVVLGPSGSGKTTLLNLVGALDTPSDGVIEVAGRSLTRSSRRELFEHRDGTTFSWVESRVPVRAMHDSPYRFVAYMDLADRTLFGLDGLVSSLKVQPTADASLDDLQPRIAGLSGVASALPASAVSQTARDQLFTLRRLFLILQAMVAALAFLVAFNASHVAADERRRENATMFAFGVRVRRVLGIEVGESLMLGALGVLLGLGFGAAILRLILETVFPAAAPDLAVAQVVAPASYAITIGIALAATAAAPVLNLRTLQRMDIPSTLRYVE
jgi:putative ABC transport system permease protein